MGWQGRWFWFQAPSWACLEPGMAVVFYVLSFWCGTNKRAEMGFVSREGTSEWQKE